MQNLRRPVEWQSFVPCSILPEAQALKQHSWNELVIQQGKRHLSRFCLRFWEQRLEQTERIQGWSNLIGKLPILMLGVTDMAWHLHSSHFLGTNFINFKAQKDSYRWKSFKVEPSIGPCPAGPA